MLKRFTIRAVAVLALAAIVMGAREAFAASRTANDPTCPEMPNYNWCATSLGEDQNCTECCQLNSYEDGLCGSYEETEIQHCLCF
jgi:hypothetical protein